jgi:hypothetical protein
VDEREFLNSLCAKALEIEDSIKFAAVINHEGKLIVGASMRFIIQQQDEVTDNYFFKTNHNSFYPISLNDNYSSNSFINNKENDLYSNLHDRSDFQLINIEKNTFIALTPLTEEQDKYLCFYFESSISFLYKTLLKLNKYLNILNEINL